MKKALALLLSLMLLMIALPVALAEEVVNVYNWEDYISEEALEMFSEETGIAVNYMRFTTNEDMLVQLNVHRRV